MCHLPYDMQLPTLPNDRDVLLLHTISVKGKHNDILMPMAFTNGFSKTVPQQEWFNQRKINIWEGER